jgi:hypothetical protein
VAPDAEPEVVDAAYRALARKYHPDVNRAPEAQRRMQTINDAYAVLRDPLQRSAYDQTHPATSATTRPPPPPSSAPAEAPPPAGTSPAGTPPAGASFRDAVAEIRRGWRSRGARESSRRFLLGAGTVVLLALLAAGGWVAWQAWQGGTTGAAPLQAYRRAAADARAPVDASRRDFDAARGDGGLPAAAGNPQVPAAAARLAADLDAATARLKGANRIPPEVEAYHFLQLQDWQEERQIVLAYRDAAVTRNGDLWARTAEVDAAWRASAPHQQVETLAKQLSAG